MIFGLVFLLVLIFIISIGISSGDYSNTYICICMLTLCLWGGINASVERKYDGCLPDAIFLLALFAWLMLSATGNLGEYFEIFMFFYIIIVLTFILVSVNLETNTKHEKLKITSKQEGKIRAQIILDSLNWVRIGSLQSDNPTYIAYRNNSPNIADFDWVLEYIMIYGSDHNCAPSNFNTNKSIFINKNLYMCSKINTTYTVTQIYRQPISDAEKAKLETLVNSKAAPKAKSLTDALYINMITNTSEGNITKSSVLNQNGIVEDIQEEEDNVSQKSINEQQNAIRILNEQNWEQINNTNDGRRQYCCRKQFAPNPGDFKWVVEYLSGIGTPEQPNNPCSYIFSKIDGIDYKSIKVNKYFEGTVIYKFTEAETKVSNVANNESDLYTQIIKHNVIKNKRKIERRLMEDPIVQYNIQLIKEKEAELKIKIEEYKEFRSKQADEIFISQSTTGMIDFEDYESQLESMRDEITDLKEEIQDLREEIEDIRQDIEDEIEDEEWEREMN